MVDGRVNEGFECIVYSNRKENENANAGSDSLSGRVHKSDARTTAFRAFSLRLGDGGGRRGFNFLNGDGTHLPVTNDFCRKNARN